MPDISPQTNNVSAGDGWCTRAVDVLILLRLVKRVFGLRDE